MGKELSIAIVLGILIGFIVGFGVWRANKLINIPSSNVSNLQPDIDTSESEDQPTSDLISLSKPKANQIISSDGVNVTGITTPDTYVTLLSLNGGYIKRSNDKGVFEIPFPLEGGVNKFKLDVLSDGTLKGDTEIQVVLSTEFFDTEINSILLQDSVNSASASESAEEKSARLEIEILKKNPTSYIGVITQITENKLEIEGTNSEILLANMGTSTKYINSADKEIKFTDLAIGDHVAALGFKVENKILDTKRVLLTTPSDFSNRFALAGSVTKIDKKVMTLTSDGKEFSLTFPKSWTGPEIKEISDGDKVIALGANDDGKYTIEVIEIVSSTSN